MPRERPRGIHYDRDRRLILMPINESGDYLDAPDLVYVSDLTDGAERDGIERDLAKRTDRFRRVFRPGD